MRTKLTLFVLAFFIPHLMPAQGTHKITGPLSVYHIATGYTYSDTSGIDSVLVQSVFKFGELAISNQSVDNGLDFIPELDSCAAWHANRIFGIIQPPNEHGVYNQPGDTALYAPYPQLSGPGLIQGGQRFSRLSQLYGGYSGVIMDDWNWDSAITNKVRQAVRGKPVDAAGNVCTSCAETTPYNKLITVIYNTGVDTAKLYVMDGLFYSYFSGQNCCYQNFDADINILRNNFPNKEIMFCIFVNNTGLGWTQADGIQYLLQHSLDRYDAGDINGVSLFAGPFLLRDYMPLSVWDSLALPQWLDSLYFPFLGEGQGYTYDCNGGGRLSGANVHVYCKGRVSGDTLLRSNQKTDAKGNYHFGLWAGNRNTDSTYYWIIAEKSGYITDTVGFWIKRNQMTDIPPIRLCSGITGSAARIQAYPNPSNRYLTVEVGEAATTATALDVYDIMGRKVYSAPVTEALSNVDLSSLQDGIYQVIVSQSWGWIVLGQRRILLHR